MTQTTTPTTYELRAGEAVTILRSTPDLLEAEAVIGPDSRPPKHLHPAQDERFEVRSGVLRVTLGRETRVLRAGDTLDIPRGTPHSMCGADEQTATVIWQTRPRLGTERWWADLDATNRRYGGTAPLPVLAKLVRRHDDVFRLALPGVLHGPALALLARLPARRPRA